LRWCPIVDRPLRARTVAAIDRLAGMLREPDARASASLALGDAGTAVLFAYLARAGYPVRGAGRVARRYAERAAAAVATTAMPLGLFGGAAGVAWMLQHLRGRELPGADVCADFDAVLLRAVARGAFDGTYDLVSGLAGIGIYALERRDRALLAAVVDRLAARSVEHDGGAVWIAAGSDVVDVGTAHGIAGIVAVLGQAHAVGIPGADELARRASRWLRARARWTQPSVFPAMVSADGGDGGDCRLAWCYGDVGVACALGSVADATGAARLGGEAVRVARRAAVRPAEDTRVVDRGVCHGAAGLALGLQRMYAVSGVELLAAAARRWLARSLDDELSRATLDAEAAQGRGLLGAAGLGLAYLAAATARAPRWCSVLAMLPVGRARAGSAAGRRARGSRRGARTQAG
jgi:lantibiotic biosynthesis protein